MSKDDKVNKIEHFLKIAVKNKDELAVMILTKQLENLGYKVQFFYS